jgi:hypothetical protein
MCSQLSSPAGTTAMVCLPATQAVEAAAAATSSYGAGPGSVDTTLYVDGKAVQGYAKGDYVCVDGIGSSSKPRSIVRKYQGH